MLTFFFDLMRKNGRKKQLISFGTNSDKNEIEDELQ